MVVWTIGCIGNGKLVIGIGFETLSPNIFDKIPMIMLLLYNWTFYGTMHVMSVMKP